jgi:hypothetical protein
MKKQLIIFSLLALFSTTLFSQTKPKKNPATQKELEEQMNAAQQQMNKMTPEQKKMMEQMGIKIPDPIPLPKNVSDKQIARATGNSIVPEKDLVRIVSISKTPLTDITVIEHLKKADAEIIKAFSQAEKEAAAEAYQLVKNKYSNNSTAIDNSSIQLWMLNEFKTSLYTASKNCINNSNDGNLLNNYGAFLSMAGAEQLTIPLLDYLNQKHPNNSTILNNLAQAWFGLGDLEKAKLYADKCIMICSWHPQANRIISAIEQKNGNTPNAIVAEKKSIEKLYSLEKENNLRKLGYKLSSNDVSFPLKPNSDPLGLHNFSVPASPKSAEEEVNTAEEWMSYSQELQGLIEEKTTAIQQLSNPKQQEMMKNAQKYLDGKTINFDKKPKPFFYNKAKLKLAALDKDGGVNFRYNKALNELKQYVKTLSTLKKTYYTERNKLDKDDNSREGAGGIDCKDLMALQDKYLKNNAKFDQLSKEYLHQTRLKLNEEIYWKQFMQSREQFEITKLDYQLQWLAALAATSQRFVADEHRFYGKDYVEHCIVENPQTSTSKLSDFNDINCQYKSEFNAYWGKITTTCDKVEIELKIDIMGVKWFEAKGNLNDGQVKDWNQEWWQTTADSFVNCTIEAGISKDKRIGDGPLKLEVEVEGNVVVEIGREGITDLGIKAGVNVNTVIATGENEPEISATIIGVETKTTINSGFNIEGKGILAIK